MALVLFNKRIDKGLTYRQLAQLCGYNHVSINKWETDGYGMKVDSLIDWAEALGMELVLRKKDEK